MKQIQLDLGELKCPLPVLKARKSMKQLVAGDQLIVKTTDPMSDIDIPHFCQEHGHKLLAKVKTGNTTTFTIEKGE